MLGEHLPSAGLRGLVVSGDRSAAEETQLRLREAIPAELAPSESKGFSNFLLLEQPLAELLHSKE